MALHLTRDDPPARIVVRTRASAPMSRAGSPSSTTTSASNPIARRPVLLAAPKRAAGAVVNEARMWAYDRPVCWRARFDSTSPAA